MLRIKVKRTFFPNIWIFCATSYGIAMRRPSNEDYMWTVYTKQFERSVWGMMGTVALASVTALHIISRWSKHERKIHLSESFFTVVGFLFGQGALQYVL